MFCLPCCEGIRIGHFDSFRSQNPHETGFRFNVKDNVSLTQKALRIANKIEQREKIDTAIDQSDML